MNRLPRSLAPAADFLARHSALIALAAFAAVGLVVLDDYGVSIDEGWQRRIGRVSLDYILGNENALTIEDHNRFYGVAFESPLTAVERVLGRENLRDIYLSRRLLTHAFFLAGGFFAWLLARRLFGNRLVALFAMSLFLLHPRIYAHAFFNSKDPPFLSMFMVSLYLIHRAFRRNSVWAFALCGAGVGLLANMRIMGIGLVPAVLSMLALDAFYGVKRGGGVKRAFANACAFLAMFAATFYAAWPLLWRDPLMLIEAVDTLFSMFIRGGPTQWRDTLRNLIPIWMLTTTPPVALALAALGVLGVARLCAVRWRDALANSTARFGLLAFACLVLPIAAVAALNSNLHDNDWRQMYFIYAPLCVLAAFGLRALADIPKPAVRAGAFAAVALGIAFTVVQMVSLHPHQSEYLTPLVDRDALANNLYTDSFGIACLQGMELALAMQPTGRVSVNSKDCTQYALASNRRVLPDEDRRRLSINRAFPDFWVGKNVENATVKREIYGFSIEAARDARPEARAAYRRLYDAARSREPLFRGRFDIHLADGFLIYLKEPCAESDTLGTFAADARPVHPDAISAYVRYAPNFARVEFDFWNYGAFVGDACLMTLPLPTYPLESLALSYAPPDGEGGAPAWSAEIPANAHLNAYARAMKSEPAARAGGFAIYADEERGALIYVKAPCDESDSRGRFLLSAFPSDPRDLPESMRKGGLDYDYLDFDFHRYGGLFDGVCVIVRDLPDYPISHLHAGQWLPEEGGGSLWSAQIVLDAARYDRFAQALANLPSEPSARADFDVYADDRTITYVKSPCGESDAGGRFILSIFPADPDDLPQASRDAGLEHEQLNFDFHRRGAIIGGACVIMRDLPNYPISHIETGQRADGEGELWSARIPFAAYYDEFRRALESLSGEPRIRSDFDVYADDRTITYVKAHCVEEDTRGRFILSAFPSGPRDLPQHARDAGLEHEQLNFDFHRHGAIIGGKCVIVRELPDYPISHIETGQWTDGEGELWRARIPFAGYYDEFRRALTALPAEPSASAGGFDIYANGGALAYIKENCGEADVSGRFNLSVFSADQSGGPLQIARDKADMKRESLDFDFDRYGAIFDGKCVIIRELPGYPIIRIETGQRTEDGGELWSVETPLEGRRQQYRDALTSLSGELPAIRSEFDVYMKDGALAYVKTHCSEPDARGRFFLSVFPADPRDLPQASRGAGLEHASLNFAFDQYGAIFEGKCVIVRDLPGYPISRVETGQWTDGEGNLWSGMIEVGN